jgi:ATP-dependent RNA helicase DeaD
MHTEHHAPSEFTALGADLQTGRALHKMGFEHPSDIQKALIPLLLEGKDVVGQAKTGTGKTAAFGIPTLQRLDPAGRLQAICLVPTRELAVQVAAEIRRLAEFTGLRCIPIYGGQRISQQIHALGRKPHFVVGTPGRVMDFMERGLLSLAEIRVAILDEVDRMLDIGFRDDIRKILGTIKHPHQTVFVSATLSDEIKRLVHTHASDPVEVNVSRDELTVDEVEQFYVSVEAPDKFRLLMALLAAEKPTLSIVFCNTKAAVRKLAKKLFQAGVNAKEIHGDLVQQRRERVMDRFRKHHIQVLVATDLAARGIDVSLISHIVNYDVPQDSDAYVHRIGRTARMGAKGKAFTFVMREQGKELTEIEMLINKQIEQAQVPGFAAVARAVEAPSTPSAPVRYYGFGQADPEAQPAPEQPPPSEAATSSPPPRPLGGKFPPRRRRRLR